ncbi:MAG: MobF family relaxase [Acidimicrobiales bacterium]
MLSISPLTNGPGYYLECANLNYYTGGGEPLPVWHGGVAHEFGISGVAEREHVERLCAGFDHLTGSHRLVRNAGTETRNPGHDLCCSAPKSASLVWALGDESLRKSIEEKHLAAVREALDYLEEKAGRARVGTDGQVLVRCPLLFALFQHGTSRANDPQLHTHALCINLTVHPDGRTTAIDSTYLYHHKMAAGAIYRVAFARGCQELGFEVEQRRVGSSIGFEVTAVPESLIEHFSKRRAEIEEELKLRAGSLDAASPKYAEMVTKETRRTKDPEKSRAELIGEWQAIGRAMGVDAAHLNEQRRAFEPLPAEELARRKEDIARESIAALSAQHSHWNEADFAKAVAERAAGRLSARETRDLIKEKLQSGDLVPLGGLITEHRNSEQSRYIDRVEQRYSCPEIVALEAKMLRDIDAIVKGRASTSPSHLIEGAIGRSRPTLDQEQAEAVRYLLTGPNIRLCSGLAGTGKTHMLTTCHEVWKGEGRDVVGSAVAAAAAQRLEEKTGIRSDTLDRTLYLLDSGQMQLTARSVVLVDEAGMLGTRSMARLIEHVSKVEGARLIGVGDAKQLQSIDAGGAFKYAASILGEVRLENVRRQREEWARESVKNFERGEAREGLKGFADHGRLHVAETGREAMAAMLDQWKKDGGVTDPARVFLLAARNSEVKEICLRAQAERIRAGEVDPDKKIFANGVYFHEGDRLQFQKNSRVMGVANSDSGTVLKVDQDRQTISVRLDKDEREITVSLKRYSPENLRLGYCSTVHKAQGASLPVVHVLLSESGMLDLHMGYVMASRSIESTHLFCERAEATKPELAGLVKALGCERQKTLAHEIIRPRSHHEIENRPGIAL